MWRKLSAWLDAVSKEQEQPSWAEWFQWLAEQLKAVEGRKQPAHLRFKDWHLRHATTSDWAR
jgi:hypothetical protein